MIDRPPVPVFESKLCRLFCGDSLTIVRQLAESLAGRAVHVITDPPYASGGQYRGDRQQSVRQKYQHTSTEKRYPDFRGDHLDADGIFWNYRQLLRPLWEVSEDRSHLVSFCDWRNLSHFAAAAQSAGYVQRTVAIWDKTTAARPVRNGFRVQSELIIHATRGPVPRDAGPYLPGVLTHRIDHREKLHLTAKPLALMRELVRFAQPGDVIVDPFAGSGTTLAAAIEAGIECVGIEADEDSCRIAAERLAAVEPQTEKATP